MATKADLQVRLDAAEAECARLQTAVEQLGDDAPAEVVERLGNSLTIQEGRRDLLKQQIEEVETEESQEEAEAQAIDRAGLLNLYDENEGQLSHLPRALQARIREEVRKRGEAALMRNARDSFRG